MKGWRPLGVMPSGRFTMRRLTTFRNEYRVIDAQTGRWAEASVSRQIPPEGHLAVLDHLDAQL